MAKPSSSFCSSESNFSRRHFRSPKIPKWNKVGKNFSSSFERSSPVFSLSLFLSRSNKEVFVLVCTEARHRVEFDDFLRSSSGEYIKIYTRRIYVSILFSSCLSFFLSFLACSILSSVRQLPRWNGIKIRKESLPRTTSNAKPDARFRDHLSSNVNKHGNRPCPNETKLSHSNISSFKHHCTHSGIAISLLINSHRWQVDTYNHSFHTKLFLIFSSPEKRIQFFRRISNLWALLYKITLIMGQR